MTDYPDALVEVTQADRRAAPKYYGYDDEKELTYWGNTSNHRDVERLAQAFARHRIEIRKAAMEEAAELADREGGDAGKRIRARILAKIDDPQEKDQ